MLGHFVDGPISINPFQNQRKPNKIFEKEQIMEVEFSLDMMGSRSGMERLITRNHLNISCCGSGVGVTLHKQGLSETLYYLFFQTNTSHWISF